MKTKLLSVALVLALILSPCQISTSASADTKNTKDKKYLSYNELQVKLATQRLKASQKEINKLKKEDDTWYDEIVVNTKTGTVTKDGKKTTLKKEFDVSSKKEKAMKKSKSKLEDYFEDNSTCETEIKNDKVVITNDFQFKRLIVETKDGKVKRTYGADQIAYGVGTNAYLQYETEEECERAYKKLKKDKSVVAVEPDGIVTYNSNEEPAKVEDIPTLSEIQNWNSGCGNTGDTKWNYLLTGLTNLESNCVYYLSHETTVAVLDTGCDVYHSALSGRLYGGATFSNGVASLGASDISGSGHGTHVAGTIVGGTPSFIKILPVNVFHSTTKEDGTPTIKAYSCDIVEGINYAIQSGAKVINMSLGFEVSTAYGYDTLEKNAIEKAYNANIVCVTSAGNEKIDVAYASPANLSATVAVSAMNPQHVFDSSYSNYGNMIDYCCPGTGVTSTVPTRISATGFADLNGTSMATPHMSAVFAYIKAINPNYTVEECKTIANSMCVDYGATGKDIYYGNGVPDVTLMYTKYATRLSDLPIDPNTCEHKDKNLIASKSATCEEDGYKTYQCPDCKATFYETIPALGHDYIEDVSLSKEPTCTEDGYTYYKCSRCGAIKMDPIEKLGHSWKLIESVDPTCTEDGYDLYKCSRCNETKKDVIPKLDHEYIKISSKCKAPTCFEEGYDYYECSRCGDVKKVTINKLDHKYIYQSTVNPTCTEDGYDLYKCSLCNGIKKDVIPALGHKYIKDVSLSKEPTCTEDGYTLYKCSRCGDVKTEPIPKLGHNFVYSPSESYDATCTQNGKKVSICSVCGEKQVTTIPALGHDYGSVETKATCTTPGKITYTCKRCGDTYETIIPATGHSWKVKSRMEPTAFFDGFITYECENCHAKKEEILPRLDVATQPTTFAKIINSGDDNDKDYIEITVPSGKAKITKVKTGKKMLRVYWNKVKGCNRYQVQISTSKNFKKGKQQKFTRNKSMPFLNLKKGKTYYIRVRGYLLEDGDKYYAKYSKVKKVKCK